MNVQGFLDALDTIGAALDSGTPHVGPAGLPVHLLPLFGDSPVAAPCIIVGWPDLADPVRAAGSACGSYWSATVGVTVVGESTRAVQLPGLLDAVMAQLAQHNLTVTATTTDPYQPPDYPAGLPAVTLTVE